MPRVSPPTVKTQSELRRTNLDHSVFHGSPDFLQGIDGVTSQMVLHFWKIEEVIGCVPNLDCVVDQGLLMLWVTLYRQFRMSLALCSCIFVVQQKVPDSGKSPPSQ